MLQYSSFMCGISVFLWGAVGTFADLSRVILQHEDYLLFSFLAHVDIKGSSADQIFRLWNDQWWSAVQPGSDFSRWWLAVPAPAGPPSLQLLLLCGDHGYPRSHPRCTELNSSTVVKIISLLVGTLFRSFATVLETCWHNSARHFVLK